MCEFEKAPWHFRRQGSPETKGYEAGRVGPLASPGTVVTKERLHVSLGRPCNISGDNDHQKLYFNRTSAVQPFHIPREGNYGLFS